MTEEDFVKNAAGLQTENLEQHYVLGTYLLICSHFFLLPSLYWTWKRRKRLWIEFSAIVMIFIWSMMYHTCYQTDFCFFTHGYHRTLDHYFAQLSVPIAVFYLGCVDKVHVKGMFYVIVAQVNFIATHYYGVCGKPKMIVLATSTLLAIFYLLARKFFYRKQTFKHFNFIDAGFGVFICFASTFFLKYFDIGNKDYFLMHSVWHFLSFGGSYFILESRNPYKTLGIPIEAWVYWDAYFRRKISHKSKV